MRRIAPTIPGMDTQATTAQLEAIKRAAQERRGFLLWLAEKLERTSDELIRKEAAKAIRQLVG